VARTVAPFFRISDPEAVEIIDEIKEVVSTWQRGAKKLNISREEVSIMASAFLPNP